MVQAEPSLMTRPSSANEMRLVSGPPVFVKRVISIPMFNLRPTEDAISDLVQNPSLFVTQSIETWQTANESDFPWA
jgi:hypothetical protein